MPDEAWLRGCGGTTESETVAESATEAETESESAAETESEPAEHECIAEQAVGSTAAECDARHEQTAECEHTAECTAEHGEGSTAAEYDAQHAHAVEREQAAERAAVACTAHHAA